MWLLDRPNHSAHATFTTCISRVRNAGLASRLTAATPTVVTSAAEFDRAARRGVLHTLAPHDIVDPDVTKDEMEKVYSQRMAKAGAPGRNIYDDILSIGAQS